MSRLGAMLGVPKWETIMGLVILSWESLGSGEYWCDSAYAGSSIEAWMLGGMAMRMCQEMGLHRVSCSVSAADRSEST